MPGAFRGPQGKLSVAAAALLLAAGMTGCDDSGTDAVFGGTLVAGCVTAFDPAQIGVALDCGTVSGDEIIVNVLLTDGVTDGNGQPEIDLFTYGLDLQFDDDLFEYVPGSFVEGPLLSAGGAGTIAAAEIVDGTSNVLLVSVSRTGQGSGIDAPATDTVMFSVTFRALGDTGVAQLSVPDIFLRDSLGGDDLTFAVSLFENVRLTNLFVP